MISFKQTGDFSKTFKFFDRVSKINYGLLNQYGEEGVKLLSNGTPKDSGETANAWSYKIEPGRGRTTIYWSNSNVVNDVQVAVILQYGHGTKNGGWVAGRDYINPAIRPIFDKMADTIWKEVTK